MNTQYTIELKRKLCTDICINGKSTIKTAEEYNVPLKTLEKWITAFNKDRHCFDPKIDLINDFKIINEPNDSNYDDVPYSDFDITFHAEKSSAESIGVDNISISSDRGSDNITTQIRNESGETAAYIRIYCLFFNENGVLIDEEYHFAKCTNPYSTDYISFSYPHDSNYDTVVPSSYKIYTVEAYRYSWT